MPSSGLTSVALPAWKSRKQIGHTLFRVVNHGNLKGQKATLHGEIHARLMKIVITRKGHYEISILEILKTNNAFQQDIAMTLGMAPL